MKQKKKQEFEEVFTNPEYLDTLRQFMIKNLCIENLNFYEAVLNYKRAHALPSTPQKETFVKDLAKSVYNQFISPRAPEEINIDGKERDMIQDALGTDLSFPSSLNKLMLY